MTHRRLKRKAIQAAKRKISDELEAKKKRRWKGTQRQAQALCVDGLDDETSLQARVIAMMFHGMKGTGHD